MFPDMSPTPACCPPSACRPLSQCSCWPASLPLPPPPPRSAASGQTWWWTLRVTSSLSSLSLSSWSSSLCDISPSSVLQPTFTAFYHKKKPGLCSSLSWHDCPHYCCYQEITKVLTTHGPRDQGPSPRVSRARRARTHGARPNVTARTTCIMITDGDTPDPSIRSDVSELQVTGNIVITKSQQVTDTNF